MLRSRSRTLAAGLALVAASAGLVAGTAPPDERRTILIPGGEVGISAPSYEEIVVPTPVAPKSFDSRAEGVMTPEPLPRTDGDKGASTRLDSGTRLPRRPPTAREREKLRLAREAVDRAEAAGTRRLAWPADDVEQAAMRGALEVKKRKRLTSEPEPLDHTPGGAR